VSDGSTGALTELGRLTHIDEHARVMAVSPQSAWTALLGVVAGAFTTCGAEGIARILGCVDVESSGLRPLAVGSTCPGFHVLEAEELATLALAGEHRFSRYALIFRLQDLGTSGTRLAAETRADFPGIKGNLYRGLVIGTRAHVVVTRSLLAAVQRRTLADARVR
jgi:hypothetical protein